MRYLARISYDGSHFEGFQRLKNGNGVQNELERVLSIINKNDVFVKGAGRTDAGVHALDQCISFDLDFEIDDDKLKYVLNRSLSPYIAVNSIQKVDLGFHARFKVKEKTYLYKIYLGEKNPLLQDYAYFVKQDLDINKMIDAASSFIGRYDFRNFVSGYRDNYVSTIQKIEIKKEGDFINIFVVGNSFYRYMVRSIVGSLVEVGLGQVSKKELANALDCPEIEKRFLVVPSCGLYLYSIKY